MMWQSHLSPEIPAGGHGESIAGRCKFGPWTDQFLLPQFGIIVTRTRQERFTLRPRC